MNPQKRPCTKNSGTIKCKISKNFFYLGTGYFCNGYGISFQLPPLNETKHSFCHLSFPVYTPDWWIPTDGFPLQAITPHRWRIKFNKCTSSGVTETYLPYHKTLNCLWITWGFYWNTDSDSVGLGWGLRFCICNKLPEDADATGL